MRAAALAAAVVLATSCSAAPPPILHGSARPPSLVFTDATHGVIAIGTRLFGSADGGTTWVRRYAGPAVISSLNVVRGGWYAADGNAVRRSLDGGRSWTAIGFTPAPIVALQYVGRTAWAVTDDGQLLDSADAGRTWSREGPRTRIESLCFTSQARGWVAGGSRIFATRDGGRSWRRVLTFESQAEQLTASLRCADGGAWALFEGGAAAGSRAYAVFADTGDGWRPRLQNLGIVGAEPPERIDAYDGPFTVVDRKTAIFVGLCPACDPQPRPSVTVTLDAGATFAHHDLTLAGSPSAVSFVDATHGWILMEDGRVLGTDDGGATFEVLATVPISA